MLLKQKMSVDHYAPLNSEAPITRCWNIGGPGGVITPGSVLGHQPPSAAGLKGKVLVVRKVVRGDPPDNS